MSFLRISDISKQYPGTLALDNVNIVFESGKVNAVIGKNGSGKSTLIKIISGAIKQSGGALFLEDEELRIHDPQDGFKNGIATVYQELSLVPSLSIGENIYLGRLERRNGFIHWKEIHRKANNLLADMNIDLSSETLVSDLSMWQRQMIEIVKALSHNPKVLMLDEPTSALAQGESELLFDFIRKVVKMDVIIIYISHRLQELWKIADRCSILRDGLHIGTIEMSTATRKDIVHMMFGDVEIKQRPNNIEVRDEVVLRTRNLSRKGYFSNISFSLKKGEILGIAGMLGSGRTELLKSIFGADPYDSGEVYIKENKVKKSNPIKVKRMGVALTPEDRKHEGLIQVLSVKDNLCAASLDMIARKIFVNKKKENDFVERQIEGLDIKIPSKTALVSSLSGGNQQKVVVGNWLNTDPEVILLDEPSRGIDVKAKQQIFQVIWDQARKGISCIMVSSELEELLEVCHRILIIREGQITGEVSPDSVSIEELYSICMGSNDQ